MDCRNQVISDDTKLFFPFNDVRTPLIDSVSGTTYDPTAVGKTTPGTVSFDAQNAVNIVNGFDGSTSVKVPLAHNLTFSTRKVILLAAVVNQVAVGGIEGTRVNLGVGDGLSGDEKSLFSLSLVGSFHASITDMGSAVYSQSLGVQKLLNNDGVPNVIYLLWDGIGSSASVAGTVTAKALNMDGSVFNDGVDDFSIIDDTVIFTNDSFSPNKYSRLTSADYFCMMAKEIDYLPRHLDYKLAQWGANAINGFKGAPRL